MGSFAVQNFRETYVDSFVFFLESLVQSSKSEDNFSIRSRNKTKKRFHENSVSKILSGIETPSPHRTIFSYDYFRDDFPDSYGI